MLFIPSCLWPPASKPLLYLSNRNIDLNRSDGWAKTQSFNWLLLPLQTDPSAKTPIKGHFWGGWILLLLISCFFFLFFFPIHKGNQKGKRCIPLRDSVFLLQTAGFMFSWELVIGGASLSLQNQWHMKAQAFCWMQKEAQNAGSGKPTRREAWSQLNWPHFLHF